MAMSSKTLEAAAVDEGGGPRMRAIIPGDCWPSISHELRRVLLRDSLLVHPSPAATAASCREGTSGNTSPDRTATRPSVPSTPSVNTTFTRRRVGSGGATRRLSAPSSKQPAGVPEVYLSIALASAFTRWRDVLDLLLVESPAALTNLELLRKKTSNGTTIPSADTLSELFPELEELMRDGGSGVLATPELQRIYAAFTSALAGLLSSPLELPDEAADDEEEVPIEEACRRYLQHRQAALEGAMQRIRDAEDSGSSQDVLAACNEALWQDATRAEPYLVRAGAQMHLLGRRQGLEDVQIYLWWSTRQGFRLSEHSTAYWRMAEAYLGELEHRVLKEGALLEDSMFHCLLEQAEFSARLAYRYDRSGTLLNSANLKCFLQRVEEQRATRQTAAELPNGPSISDAASGTGVFSKCEDDEGTDPCATDYAVPWALDVTAGIPDTVLFNGRATAVGSSTQHDPLDLLFLDFDSLLDILPTLQTLTARARKYAERNAESVHWNYRPKPVNIKIQTAHPDRLAHTLLCLMIAKQVGNVAPTRAEREQEELDKRRVAGTGPPPILPETPQDRFLCTLLTSLLFCRTLTRPQRAEVDRMLLLLVCASSDESFMQRAFPWLNLERSTSEGQSAHSPDSSSPSSEEAPPSSAPNIPRNSGQLGAAAAAAGGAGGAGREGEGEGDGEGEGEEEEEESRGQQDSHTQSGVLPWGSTWTAESLRHWGSSVLLSKLRAIWIGWLSTAAGEAAAAAATDQGGAKGAPARTRRRKDARAPEQSLAETVHEEAAAAEQKPQQQADKEQQEQKEKEKDANAATFLTAPTSPSCPPVQSAAATSNENNITDLTPAMNANNNNNDSNSNNDSARTPSNAAPSLARAASSAKATATTNNKKLKTPKREPLHALTATRVHRVAQRKLLGSQGSAFASMLDVPTVCKDGGVHSGMTQRRLWAVLGYLPGGLPVPLRGLLEDFPDGADEPEANLLGADQTFRWRNLQLEVAATSASDCCLNPCVLDPVTWEYAADSVVDPFKALSIHIRTQTKTSMEGLSLEELIKPTDAPLPGPGDSTPSVLIILWEFMMQHLKVLSSIFNAFEYADSAKARAMVRSLVGERSSRQLQPTAPISPSPHGKAGPRRHHNDKSQIHMRISSQLRQRLQAEESVAMRDLAPSTGIQKELEELKRRRHEVSLDLELRDYVMLGAVRDKERDWWGPGGKRAIAYREALEDGGDTATWHPAPASCAPIRLRLSLITGLTSQVTKTMSHRNLTFDVIDGRTHLSSGAGILGLCTWFDSLIKQAPHSYIFTRHCEELFLAAVRRKKRPADRPAGIEGRLEAGQPPYATTATLGRTGAQLTSPCARWPTATQEPPFSEKSLGKTSELFPTGTGKASELFPTGSEPRRRAKLGPDGIMRWTLLPPTKVSESRDEKDDTIAPPIPSPPPKKGLVTSPTGHRIPTGLPPGQPLSARILPTVDFGTRRGRVGLEGQVGTKQNEETLPRRVGEGPEPAQPYTTGSAFVDCLVQESFSSDLTSSQVQHLLGTLLRAEPLGSDLALTYHGVMELPIRRNFLPWDSSLEVGHLLKQNWPFLPEKFDEKALGGTRTAPVSKRFGSEALNLNLDAVAAFGRVWKVPDHCVQAPALGPRLLRIRRASDRIPMDGVIGNRCCSNFGFCQRILAASSDGEASRWGCQLCGRAFYCSETCQAVHKAAHAYECQSFRDLRMAGEKFELVTAEANKCFFATLLENILARQFSMQPSSAPGDQTLLGTSLARPAPGSVPPVPIFPGRQQQAASPVRPKTMFDVRLTHGHTSAGVIRLLCRWFSSCSRSPALREVIESGLIFCIITGLSQTRLFSTRKLSDAAVLSILAHRMSLHIAASQEWRNLAPALIPPKVFKDQGLQGLECAQYSAYYVFFRPAGMPFREIRPLLPIVCIAWGKEAKDALLSFQKTQPASGHGPGSQGQAPSKTSKTAGQAPPIFLEVASEHIANVQLVDNVELDVETGRACFSLYTSVIEESNRSLDEPIDDAWVLLLDASRGMKCVATVVPARELRRGTL